MFLTTYYVKIWQTLPQKITLLLYSNSIMRWYAPSKQNFLEHFFEEGKNLYWTLSLAGHELC